MKHSVMRRLHFPAIAVGVMVASALTTAQRNPYRNYTVDKFVLSMQTAGRNFGAVNDLLAKNDFETAKAQLTRAREQLAITVQFWRDKQKDDAVKMLRDTLTKMDALDAELSREKVDAATVSAAARQVNAACQTCHAGYRDQDPATKAYRLKPGSVQ